jgi:hypothetical protein
MPSTRRPRWTSPIWLAVSLAVVLGAAIAIAVTAGHPTRQTSQAAPTSASDAGPTRAVPGSVQPASNATLTPSCQIASPRTTLGPQATLPANPTHTLVSPAGGVVDFAAGPLSLSIETPDHLLLVSRSGTTEHSVILPAALRTTELDVESLATDATGAIYISSYQNLVVDKFSPSGQLAWSHPLTGHPSGIFAMGRGPSFRLGLTLAGSADSILLDATGKPDGTTPLTVGSSSYVTSETNGDLLVAEGGQVRTLGPGGGVLLHEFGADLDEGQDAHTAGPHQFYYQGQAAVGPGGAVYTADPLTTLEINSPSGLLEAATSLGGHLTMSGGRLFIVGGDAYFESGTPFSSATTVSSVSLDTLDAYLAPPQPPLDALGWGAGVSTPAAGNYFPAGARPTVTASFAPWWSEMAGHLQLRYAVWDASDLARLQPPMQTVAVPATATALQRLELPLTATDAIPGPYEVEAFLYDTSSTPAHLIGSTCLPYSVGAPGDHLDLATLPAGGTNGAPSDVRNAALNAELGLDGLRGALIDWSDFLPACNASDPTAAQCGPGAFTTRHAPVSYFQAAALARRDHVTYWVQVTGGDAISTILVAKRWWQGDVEALVSYYSHPPAGCVACAPVTAWEPWNEPSTTGWSTGASYVTSVLKPFFKGVKTADPAVTVVGGSTLEAPLSWWRSLVAAHGLSYLDVTAVHPYPGNNDSWEEDGILSQVETLQHLLGHVPMWFTEVGWWSDGDYNVVNQADSVARAVLWQRILGVPVWNYYFSEGNGGTGVSFGLIQTSEGDDYVKAGALASMVVAHQTADRPYLGTVSTGILATHAVAFGPSRSAGPTDLLALWSDGLATTAELRVSAPSNGPVPVTLVDEYGASTPATLQAGKAYALAINGQVAYVIYPEDDRLSLEPTEPYGANLALASTGAQASASSGDAAQAITGSVTGTGWSSVGQADPTLTVTLPRPASVDRVVVDTQSPGSTATGLRNYTLAVRAPGAGPTAGWVTVGRVVGEYRDHQQQITFAFRAVIAVRITVSAIDYGGYADGGVPNFWPLDQTGAAFVHAVEIYAGADGPAAIDGTTLTPVP